VTVSDGQQRDSVIKIHVSILPQTPSHPRFKAANWSLFPGECGNKVQVTRSCPTLCDPMDYTVHGILQARILEWVAFPFSRGSSQPRDRTQVSRIAGRVFTSWATREALVWVPGQFPRSSCSMYYVPVCGEGDSAWVAGKWILLLVTVWRIDISTKEERKLAAQLGENGYMYLYDWGPLLSIWNCHNTVNRLYSNTK